MSADISVRQKQARTFLSALRYKTASNQPYFEKSCGKINL